MKKCVNCKISQPIEAHNFCPFCGTNLIPLNEHGKATEIQVKQVSDQEFMETMNKFVQVFEKEREEQEAWRREEEKNKLKKTKAKK